MEPTQVAFVVGAFVVLTGLLKVHRVVVRKYVVPNLEPEEDTEK